MFAINKDLISDCLFYVSVFCVIVVLLASGVMGVFYLSKKDNERVSVVSVGTFISSDIDQAKIMSRSSIVTVLAGTYLVEGSFPSVVGHEVTLERTMSGKLFLCDRVIVGCSRVLDK